MEGELLDELHAAWRLLYSQLVLAERMGWDTSDVEKSLRNIEAAMRLACGYSGGVARS